MRASYLLFYWIALAGLFCNGQEKNPNGVWKKPGVDEGLRRAFEGVVYRLKDSGPGRYQGMNPAQGLALEFNRDEARMKHPQGNVALRLTGYGYGSRLRVPLRAKLTISGNRVEYERGELSEWYVNDSRGLEQGFTLARRPGAERDGEPLVIALAVGGELRPELAPQGDAVLLRSSKGAVLRYAGLRAWDACGRGLASRLEVSEREVRLLVDDHGSEYPLVVDPVWTQHQELSASNGSAFNYFGQSVAVSGNTAMVGGYDSNLKQGAVYVFARSVAGWVQQAELTASDGSGNDQFGSAVALNGDTAVVGAYNKIINGNLSQGVAYVFVRSGTTWSQQQELILTNGGMGDHFGASVAVSGDTAVVGAYFRNAVFVYVRSGATWSQQQTLTASNAELNDNFGSSVSLDENTVLIGANNKIVNSNHAQGAAYVFVRSGVTWSQQQELLASDGAGYDSFGSSASLSRNTALIGASQKGIGSNFIQGAVYVFVRTGSTWTQQQRLTASDGASNDQFGSYVSLSGDTAVAGAWAKKVGSNSYQGAVYAFVRSGNSWSQQPELTASDGAANDEFGPVALEGSTIIVGAPQHTFGSNTYQGAAYVFTRPTVINDLSNSGLSGALLYDPSIGQSYTAISNGNGTYSYVPELFTSGFDTLRTGDFNGDGKADLVLYNSHTALAYIGMSNGDGTFAFQSLFWSPGYDFVEAGELNGDGKTDFALYNSTNGTLYTGISNGTGGFSYKYTLITSGYTFVRLADFTGDGKADIFLYNVATGWPTLVSATAQVGSRSMPSR